MTTTSTKPTARQASAGTPTEHLQEALRSVEQARQAARGDLREQLDEATDRLRATVDELRDRAGDQVREIEDSLERASDHLIVELGLRSVRAQRNVEALAKMSAEIRKRKAELTS